MCRKGLIIVVMLPFFLSSSGQNTKPKSVVKTTKYIMHVVKFGETLTKIAQKYGVSKTDILKANPSLTADNLNSEQILRIPDTGNKKVLTSSETKDSELKPKVKIEKDELPLKSKYHIVLKGQTLYSISKLYSIKVEDLQKWNDLKDFNVKVGSLLTILNPDNKQDTKVVSQNSSVKTTVPQKENQPVQTDKLLKNDEIIKAEEIREEDSEIMELPDIQANNNETQKELAKLFKEKAGTGKTQTTKGTGAPMTTTLGAMDNVYFAMHKKLAIGTIIKVKNLVNSKIVFAKVIGKLPETDENKHVIIRYSSGVKKDLQLQNGKCYIQIEYPD